VCVFFYYPRHYLESRINVATVLKFYPCSINSSPCSVVDFSLFLETCSLTIKELVIRVVLLVAACMAERPTWRQCGLCTCQIAFGRLLIVIVLLPLKMSLFNESEIRHLEQVNFLLWYMRPTFVSSRRTDREMQS
jgi:hypothetical protein